MDELDITVEWHMVTTDSELAALCTRWQQCDLLALDTEFIRTRTYFPQLGLLQLCDGEEIWLIDPLVITRWDEFKALMQNQAVTKVFHSCSEDLLTFIAFFGLLPQPLFDTQIAATLLGMGMSLSYQNLVRNYKAIDLPKGETRSDWLQRPLSESQLEYAALDVIYLPEISRLQMEALAASGKKAWAEEEYQRLLGSYDQEFTRDFSDTYLSMKGAWQFDGRQLLALRLLCAWREHRARDRDRPRNWILRDNALYDIARLLPGSSSELEKINEISPNFLRYEGDQVLKLVSQACSEDPAVYPSPLVRPLTTAQKKRLKRMKALVDEIAARVGVPPEYLGRRKTLVEYLQVADNENSLPEELHGWRGELLLEPLASQPDSEEAADD